MGSFSQASVIRNVAVVGLPKDCKNRSDSGPEWPQVSFSASGHGFTLMDSQRVPCAKQKVQIPVTACSVNRPSDSGRRKMRQAIVLDRQSDKKRGYLIEKVRNRFGWQIAAL
jgi:hypothetical protein